MSEERRGGARKPGIRGKNRPEGKTPDPDAKGKPSGRNEDSGPVKRKRVERGEERPDHARKQDFFKKSRPEERAGRTKSAGKPFGRTANAGPDKRKRVEPGEERMDHVRKQDFFKKSRPEERTGRPKSMGKPVRRKEDPDLIRLNKYIANSGVCSRREADKLIEAGAVSVNGKIVTELGTKVGPKDKVQYGDQTIAREKLRYLLLNKPKGYITTVDDPENRKTVMALVEGACRERIYPVGRLDRNTTGLLFFTNDGIIAKKLTHPRYGIRKIYQVELDRNLVKADFTKIAEGFNLDGEFIKVDRIEYAGEEKDKKTIGVELHSGQNRIVRRIFEHFEYKVTRLDRVYYAGLTKKNLPRGKWRFLDEQEINMLKMISSKP